MNGQPIRVVFLWHSLGEYHYARMNKLSKMEGIDLTVIEFCRYDKDHEWRVEQEGYFKCKTLWSGRYHRWLQPVLVFLLLNTLRKLHAQVIVPVGYKDLCLLAAAGASKTAGKKVILFTASHALDKKRHFLIEKIKQWLINRYDMILVPGERAKEYACQLGAKPEAIVEVGNVIDNGYFESEAKTIQGNGGDERVKRELPNDYFLYVGRFAKEKNLKTLLRAYKRYRESSEHCWFLVLVGGGPEESGLREFVKSNQIQNVKFYPFQQMRDLIPFYALARAFILPSISEPWGLVVNEASACSLPLLLSNRCGSIPELLSEGENGFSFDPHDDECLANRMKEFSEGKWDLDRFGKKSHELVQHLNLDTYGNKVVQALERVFK